MNSAGPTAIHERHRASGRRPLTATIACPNCGIYQPVEVDYDGDQGYAALPVTPCSVCHQDLCWRAAFTNAGQRGLPMGSYRFLPRSFPEHGLTRFGLCCVGS